jgi:aspartyl/asparaginyl-tRNA synthetase
MIEPQIAFTDLSDNAALAEALPKYTFAALLNKRHEDLAFLRRTDRRGPGRETIAQMHPDDRGIALLVFPAKAGTHLRHRHRPSPV